MRTTTVSSFLTGLMSLSLAQAQTVVNITESNTADVDAGTGELGWGASGLSFGYSAGVGLNFSSGFIAAGFNAGIPDEADGALGSGFTLNDTMLEFGFGGTFGAQTVGIALIQDRSTGEVTLTVNGNVVAL